MTEIIILVLVIALLIYVLLGGADFGAGMVEIFTGKKGVDVISRAIAPVWEANHTWVILAVVILFNGFPPVFTSITTYLHIPLLIVLLGIVLRGSAFTFRYYDAFRDKSYNYYTLLFRISSVITPFFYGMILGAIIFGKIPATNTTGSFYDLFMAPWLNFFTISTGIFLTLLFAWLASVYLIGEAIGDTSYDLFVKTARTLFILLIASGLLVFVVAELYGIHFLREFVHSPVSIVCLIIATILIPLMWRSISQHKPALSRIFAGGQTACILTGWFAMQFPVMIYMENGSNLTIYNSRAPESTMTMLFWALVVGVLIIFPAIGYLMNVFKLKGGKEAVEHTDL